MKVRPVSAEEVAEAVRSHRQVVAVGGRSKERLARAENGAVEIEMGSHSGITEYEASEYTFTAKAGTPVQEVEAALAAKGQYLPFDPHFVEGGATLGGTIASGISGPARFRYGGLRDFLLGVQFVDGTGQLVRSGGKVVKNAAGFDLPKFLVGSLGRFGILTEVTFKVFPAPVKTATLRIGCEDSVLSVERLAEAARMRWELDAVEYVEEEQALYVRLGGPAAALNVLCAEIEGIWLGDVKGLRSAEAGKFWSGAREMAWATGETLVKVPMAPSRIEKLELRLEGLDGITRRYSSGGAVGWFSVEGDLAGLDRALTDFKLGGLVVRGGEGVPLWLGARREDGITAAVKRALDPEERFPRF